SESEGIPEHKCDVPSHDNSLPLHISKDQFEDFFESKDDFSSIDDDSFSFDKIDYVEASPPDSELVSSKVTEIVIPKVGGIDDDILRDNLLNVNHLFAKIEASNDNPIPFYDPIISGTPLTLIPSGESDFFLEVDAFLAVEDEPTSSQFPQSYLDPEGDTLLLEAFLNDYHSFDFKTKSSSTSLNSLLEETNNFDNSLPEFTTFSNVLFDAEYESNSGDDQSCSNEDVLEKIVSKPLFEEEIIPMKIDQHSDNVESDLMKSLRTHDSSLLISSKIDSLLEEFAGELTLLKSIPSGIDETDCDFEEDIRLIEKFFVSLMEEIDLFCTLDYPMPPSIEDDDYDSERDILIRKDLPSTNTLSFAEKESFHFDIPPFPRPPAKPPDDQEKSPDLLSHRGLKASQPFSTCPMMIHGQNNPILDPSELLVDLPEIDLLVMGIQYEEITKVLFRLTFLRPKGILGSLTRARGAGFLWERVVEVMGSSWSSGVVVRSGEEVVAGLAGVFGVNSNRLNVGGEDKVPRNGMTKDRWLLELEVVEELYEESIEDEEVSLVDGVLEGALGALVLQLSISQQLDTQKHRKPRRKVNKVPQPSDPMKHVVDEAVYKELDDRLVRAATNASSLEAKCQDTMGDTIAQTRSERVFKLSNDSLLARGNTLQSDEDRLKLSELMKLCTVLQSRVLDLEKTKTTQALDVTFVFSATETAFLRTFGPIEPKCKTTKIMPPRRLRKKSVKKLVERRVAKAIKEYEKTRADSINAGGSGSASTGGSADVQGCSYKTFMNCKPHSFNGTEGVVGLKRWFEKMEQVFEICKCTEDDKAYNNRFHELALMCPELVPTERKKIEKYVRGFPKRIKGNITSSKPTTLHDAINMARELVEQAVQGRATRIGESNKRKRQETARTYAAAPAEGRGYAGNLPRCNRCNSHHNGQCPPKCRKCQRTGHQEKDCRVRPLQDMTCYGCDKKGHFKDKCPKGRNQQNEGARGRAYVV
nr:hypothetical protein [Tanacetum cinerariifolium]